MLGGFDSALESPNRTQLLAALSTYRDSDDSGMIPTEGGWICVGIGIKLGADGKLVVTRTRDCGETFDTLRDGLPQDHAYDLI